MDCRLGVLPKFGRQEGCAGAATCLVCWRDLIKIANDPGVRLFI